MNREAYFTDFAAVFLRDTALPEWQTQPFDYHISIGWTMGQRTRTVLGSCHPRAHSADGHNEIFLSPTESDTPLMLAVLVHELCHAADDCQSGHKGAFARYARAVGLVDPGHHGRPRTDGAVTSLCPPPRPGPAGGLGRDQAPQATHPHAAHTLPRLRFHRARVPPVGGRVARRDESMPLL